MDEIAALMARVTLRARPQGYNNPMLELVRELDLAGKGMLPEAGAWESMRLSIAVKIQSAMPTVADSLYEDALAARGVYAIPVVWLRRTVAVSLMDESGYNLIREFGNGQVWDVGAGSGYHAAILEQMGACVYASDAPTNGYEARFHPVEDEPDDAAVRRIAAGGGTALYFWPWREYYELDRWLRAGGRKVATVGCFDVPDHEWILENPGRPETEAPRLSPPFAAEGFELVSEHVPPHLSAHDPSVADVLQFWEKR